MITFLGFVLGQVFAVLLQCARWVDNTRGWMDYFRDRKHQGRHVADAIVSTFVFFAWGTGILVRFSDLLPQAVKPWVDKLPDTPGGPLVACIFGGGVAFGVRYVQKKFFDTPEPPPTAGGTPAQP